MPWLYSWLGPLDSDLHLGDLGVVEGLSVPGEGGSRLHEQHQDALHAPGRHIQVDIPQGVTLVRVNLPVAVDAVVLDADHSGQLRLGDHVILQDDVINGVTGIWVSGGLDHLAVVVESQLIFQSVTQGALVESHVALKQLEVEWHIEPVA